MIPEHWPSDARPISWAASDEHSGVMTLMAEDHEKERDELIRLLGDVEPEATTLEKLGQSIAEYARLARDLAKPLIDFFNGVPANQLSSEEWARQTQPWKAWRASASEIRGIEPGVRSFGAITMSSVNSAMSSVVLIGNNGQSVELYFDRSPAVEDILRTLERHRAAEKASDLMRRLGLDRRGGNSRPALELLNEAKSALERPVVGEGGPVSILMPLRECIDAAITELVRRRPKQEAVKGWSAKVVSVGSQCGLAPLPADHFNRLGADAEALMNELSGSKQTGMDRLKLRVSFNRGLTFLNALLGSIDGSQLRAD
jgi:hypothetical protein